VAIAYVREPITSGDATSVEESMRTIVAALIVPSSRS